ncbi:MAG: hypothetical protein Q8K75_01305 [Chlamydiales bacterium]|nr:hypothetical protein [Chlamydiales bacterium]
MVAICDLLPTRLYPAEQVQVNKEPSSKTKQLFNFAKNVTLLVGGTFGTLLAVNYLGRGMQIQGRYLIANLATDPAVPYCFASGICTTNPAIIARTIQLGHNLFIAGARLEKVTGDLLHSATAPLYSAYWASSDILAKFSEVYNNNIKPLICDEQVKVKVEQSLLTTAQEKLMSAGSSVKDIYNRSVEELSKVPENAMVFGGSLLMTLGFWANDRRA